MKRKKGEKPVPCDLCSAECPHMFGCPCHEKDCPWYDPEIVA